MRPAALPVNLDGIPQALRDARRWLLWRYLERDGRWVKYPCARVNDNADWRSFETISTVYVRGGFDGIGFVLGDGWGGLDLDHCRDSVTGICDPRVEAILDIIKPAYVETSPSQTGLKAFFRAQKIGLQIDFSKTPYVVTPWSGARFFTVTGAGSGDPMTVCDDALSFLTPVETPAPVVASGGGWSLAATTTDDDLLLSIAGSEQGPKFLKLWRGQTEGYASHSEADLALCSILAWWCDYDLARVDRLFRLSDLTRAKWDYPSYRQSLLMRASMRRVI